MRRKQLFAIILAGALAAGSAPAAVFAAESDVAAMSEEGAGDAGFEEEGSEDGSSDAETPVTDGGDAATDETPAADDTTTDETPADNTTTDETPAADNTTTDETPAAEDTTTDATPTEEAQTQEQTEENKEVDPQEVETPTETAGIVLADADRNPILDQDGKAISYTTLEEAVTGAEAYSAANPKAAVYIQLTESIVLDKTITVSGKVNICAAKDGVTISRKEDGTFTGTMFSVSGEGGQLQFFADSEKGAALTVSGALPMNDIVKTEAEGAIVDVQSNGTFVLNSGVTLTGNNYTGGGAAINCNGGTLMLAGGSVTNNISGDKGAVYSNTDISMLGNASVIGNKNIKDKDSNVYLGDEAKLILTKTREVGILTGKSTFTHAKAKAGRNVISGTTSAITKAEFEAAIKNITYDDTNYTLKADSTKFSVTLEEKKATPTTAVDYKVTYKRNTAKWRSHTVAQANFTTTATCEWAYMVVNTKKPAKPGDKVKYSISLSQLSEFTKAAANTEFTVVAENVPENAATIIVVTRLNKNDKKDKYKHALANLSESTRPAEEKKDDNNNNTQQTKRTHKVTEGRVEGLDEPIKFFSKRYVSFEAIGAGTDDSEPYVNGDERWIPEYWTFEGSNTTHKTWSIGGSNGKGVQPKNGVSQEFTILIYCKKQVYNGKTFQDTAVEDCFPWKFTAASYTDEEEQQWLKDNGYITDDTDSDGDGSGSGDGGTDAELTATAAASAKDAGSKSKSAVSTADESPIGTMSVLAALSLLAGGYVVVRKRKKEEI